MTTDRRTGSARAIGAALVVAAVVAIAWLVLASPLFEISTIEAEGNGRLSDEEVVAISGAGPGDNLVFLATGEVEDAIESSPWIADAEIRRRFPGTLSVQVRERRAVAIARDATATYLVAGDGIVLEPVDRAPALPSLGRHGSLAVGQRIEGPLAALRALASLSPDVLPRVREAGVVREASPPSVLLWLEDDAPVEFGSANQLRAKAAALAGVLAWADERGVAFRYIDVSIPDAPVLRPKGRDHEALTPEVDRTARG